MRRFGVEEEFLVVAADSLVTAPLGEQPPDSPTSLERPTA